MQYTVRSRGRAIGVTDLGFVCHDVHFRMGWFHPNELGNRLMPHISALLPALRASQGEYDETVFTLDSQILHAEEPYEEALRRVDALELTLHREDGIRVETEDLAISDTELLVASPNATTRMTRRGRLAFVRGVARRGRSVRFEQRGT